MKVSLGLDTSCYVTSAALVSEAGEVLYNGRIPLQVEEGGLGLRQSEAFFLHVRQLPALLEKAFELVRKNGWTVGAIGASDAPRDALDSYMPVFLAGLSTAKILASSHGIRVHVFSHQQGHLRAAEIGCPPLPDSYIGMHLSGGTTQVVRVDRNSWTTSHIAGTTDISAGQWIDRIGVLMGCPFPAGPSLDALAQSGHRNQKSIGIPFRDGHLSFSGAEAEVKRRLLQGEDKADIALEMFLSLSRAICKALMFAYEMTGLQDALIAGGVAANSLVRQEVINMMAKRCRDLHIWFAQREYAGDNAAGTALLAMEREVTHAQ